jgi:predicted transposase/invertase (TIGR01784 family)
MRYEAMAREKFLMDQRSRLSYAMKKGLEDGRAEGMAEGKAEVARLMMERGLDIQTIAEVTGLAMKEIEALRTS